MLKAGCRGGEGRDWVALARLCGSIEFSKACGRWVTALCRESAQVKRS